ncbi:alpha/beta hydrolase [Parafrankia soli]|uniref:Alpha/beta hydrolase n=1 Tax=Parafrankia soli TaxID=2599596 RepID=A0A1S1PF06_9ACTN|nr:alpha/beta fold hydrolase [Parafrankia soli]OHV19739.1 alpha/beta hydrolase [Parafrankia soli]
MSTIDVRGVSIAYGDTGSPTGRPDAPTIVFGHGLLFGGWVFRAQVAALREHYRCVTLDWRGQGDTPPTPGGYDMDTLTADAVAVIQRLGLAPVHWVGLSMGGFVGLRIAARHGELLRSLTLLDSSADAEEPTEAGAYRRLALVARLVGVRPVLGRVRPTMFGPSFLADPDGRPVVAEWAGRLGRVDRSALRKAVLGVADRPPVDHEIPGIAVPTLVVVGADDVATPPERAERMVARIPGARLEVVADCGHTSPLEQPDVITGLLRGFVAGA